MSDEKVALEGHNASPQTGVTPNPDPALNLANEHMHEHVHHGGAAAKHENHPHDVVYTTGTTDKPHDFLDKAQSPQNFTTKEKSVTDEESGRVGESNDDEEAPSKYNIGVLYRKYRAVVHFLIWTLWTV